MRRAGAPIRVLHVFAPNVKRRFGGQTITWKYVFSKWNDPTVLHKVLDCEGGQTVDARSTFDFDFPNKQVMITRWQRAAWIPSLFRNLIRLRGQYDILYVHVLWWGGLLVGPWAKWNGIPAVYESILLDGDTPGAMLEQGLGGLKVRWLKRYKAIIAVSEYLSEDYRKHGFRDEQVHTLINHVNTTVFSPVVNADEKIALRRELNLPQDSTVLIFVGSAIQRKGVDVLVRAFVQASASRSDLFLLIVGPKDRNENPSLDEGLVNRLREFLRDQNLSDRTAWAGLVQKPDRLAEMYRAADIFVFPSNREGLGNVVLEAMASGLPCVVSHLPVLDGLITHRQNGLFTPVGDVDAVRDAILMLSSDPELAGRLGQNALDCVKKHHSLAAWQSRMVEIYRSLL